MKNSKLIRIISVLKKEEQLPLAEYLKQQFIPKRQDLWLFFQCVKNNLLKKEENSLTKEVIFKYLFPKHSYNDGKMRKMMHELLQEIETFFMKAEANKPFVQEKQLLEFYFAHYSNKDTSEMLAKIVQKLDNYPAQDLLYWETKTQVEIYKSYEMAMQYVFKNNMNIPNIIENQKIVFFIQHLKQYFMLLGNQNLAKEIPIQPFFYHILEEIKANPTYLTIDLISVYYYAVQLFLDKENNIAFEKLRQLIVKQSPILTHTEWANLAFALRNYANEQKAFDVSFELIHFELYFEHLPLGFVFSNNHISPQTFVSIVKIGAELGKTEKIRGFFEDYQAYLPIEIKHNTLLLAEAYLLFEGKLYDASLQKLHLLEKFEHYTFELDMRMLKIQNACVLKETQFCLQQVNTFRVYIHRNEKMSENRKEKYLNFLKYISQYWELAAQDKAEKRTLLEEIKMCDTLIMKKWLLGFVHESVGTKIK